MPSPGSKVAQELMVPRQDDLFGAHSALPEGFRYQPELITPDEETELVGQLERLPFQRSIFTATWQTGAWSVSACATTTIGVRSSKHRRSPTFSCR